RSQLSATAGRPGRISQRLGREDTPVAARCPPLTADCRLPPADFSDRHLLGRQACRRTPTTASRAGSRIGAGLSRFLFARAAVVKTSACHCLVAVGGAATAGPDPPQRPRPLHHAAALAAFHPRRSA